MNINKFLENESFAKDLENDIIIGMYQEENKQFDSIVTWLQKIADIVKKEKIEKRFHYNYSFDEWCKKPKL